MENDETQPGGSQDEKPQRKGSINASQFSMAKEPSEQFVQPTCNKCRAQILGKYLLANGLTWHPDHFTCGECKAPLTQFIVQDGGYYCKNDFFKIFGVTCKACGKKITETYIAALDAFWHVHHWICEKCQTPLETEVFFEVEGKPYCRNCYGKKFCSECPKCSEPVIVDRVMFLGKRYHAECFRCQGCDKVLRGDQYFIQNRQAYCGTCSSKLIDQ